MRIPNVRKQYNGIATARYARDFRMNLMARIWIVAVLLCTWVASAFGQATTYRLKQDDIINISVYSEQQIAAQIPVGPDGNISAPYVGTVRAEGRTTAELETELIRLYKEKLKFRDPKVAVTIFRFRSIRATITGAVGRASTYDMRPGDTILTLLGFGGGAISDRAILKRCTLRRAGSSESIPVDLQALQTGDTSQDYVLEDGDVFIVPDDVTSGLSNTVMIQGAVASPGTFQFRDGMRLADAISLARGEIPNRSKFSEIFIIRQQPGLPGSYFRIKANYVKFIRQGASAENPALQAGDVIYASYTKNPDPNQIGAILNSFFLLDRFATDGLFGFRLFRL